MDNGTLFTCSVIGATPTAATVCPDGFCSVNPGLDSCGPIVPPFESCFCNSTLSICGTSVDPACATYLGDTIDPKAIYTCAGEGQIPQRQQVCADSQYCLEGSTGAECRPLCNCTGTGTQCSENFGAVCNLTEGIYNCNTTGQPEQIQECVTPQICVTLPTGPTCTPPECICQSNSTLCGSSLPTGCNATNNTLYMCTVGMLPSAIQGCDPGVCSANVKVDASSFKATASDFCISQCDCKTGNTEVRKSPDICKRAYRVRHGIGWSFRTNIALGAQLGLCLDVRH